MPLSVNNNPTFAADYHGAIVYPAHPSNYGMLAMNPLGICLHTPEEEADDNEVTPVWFSQDHNDPNKASSTTYYQDSDGDVYQCVSEQWMHFGNGVVGKPYPAWANPNINLNRQTLSIEIEGKAATIQDTLVIGGPQWLSLVALIRDRCAAYNIPMDRAHIFGHDKVSNQRTDPGALFPWADLMTALAQEDQLTAEEQRLLEDREGRVAVDWLLTKHFNTRLTPDRSHVIFYDPVSGVIAASLPAPSLP